MMKAFMFLVFVAAVVAANGCAYSHVGAKEGSALEETCGEFESAVAGIPPFFTPAGQYATYRGACAQGEFARVIAAQREAVTRAGLEAVKKVHAVDPVARNGVRRAIKGNRRTRHVLTGHLAKEGGVQ